MTAIKNVVQRVALGTALGLGTLGATSSAKAAYVDLEYGAPKQSSNQATEINSRDLHLLTLLGLAYVVVAGKVGYDLGKLRSESTVHNEECQRILQKAEELNEARKGCYQI